MEVETAFIDAPAEIAAFFERDETGIYPFDDLSCCADALTDPAGAVSLMPPLLQHR